MRKFQNFKHVLAGTLCVAMVGALTACGSSSSTSTTAAATTAAAKTETTAAAKTETTAAAKTETTAAAKTESKAASTTKAPEAFTEKTGSLTGSTSAKIHLKCGTSTAFTSPYIQGLIEMQQLLEKYSNGEMTIDLFPDSQLGNERDMVESVSSGQQEMLVTSTGPLGNFVKDFYSFDLPYLFQSADEAYQVLDGEIGEGVLKQFDSMDIYAVNFWENGFRCTTNNTREITHPADLKGLKLRTMENKIHMATYENWGVYATPMAMGEVYTALQQGTIDGEENPLGIIVPSKLYEVQKYITMNNVFYSPSVLMINKGVYEGFTADQKAAFDKAAAEAQAWERAYSQGTVASNRKILEDYGCTVTDVDQDEWVKSTQPIYDKMGDLGVNTDLVKKIQTQLGR